MIRVYKHPVAPSSLERQISWSEEDVIAQLKEDQHSKCYLCERIQITDFQVEHHKSRANFNGLRFEWTNLFWCCSYCNGKKSSSFDNLLHPASENIEELINQSLDFPNAKALFSNQGEMTEPIGATITFLDRIFNGTNKLRTIREQSFYDYAVSKITTFQEMIISWLDSSDETLKTAIIEELALTSEFLGFKYWIIKSNETLWATFGEYTTWHR